MKHALITGITGQDGSYLAELLLQQGYQVFGFARRESWIRPNNASHLESQIQILFGDVTDGADMTSALRDSCPDEIYNLASQSRPGESWARAPETLRVNGLAAIQLFEAVRLHFPQCRVYHASSSEMFGPTLSTSQNENTPFNPSNPYAAAKVYAHQMAKIYRQSFGLYIASGILFSHESERRPLHFLTQKVAYGAACAALGIVNSPHFNEVGKPIVENGKLSLGNLSIARDWGFAGDFVRAMWLMLQQEHGDDYVVGTGQLHTLEALCKTAYGCIGQDWSANICRDTALVRPNESGQTIADSKKAQIKLGWFPTVSFDQMIKRMVASQIRSLMESQKFGIL